MLDMFYMSYKWPVQNFKEIDEKHALQIHQNNCVQDYNLSNGGGWSKMKVSFSVSTQSILKRLSQNFVTILFSHLATTLKID